MKKTRPRTNHTLVSAAVLDRTVSNETVMTESRVGHCQGSHGSLLLQHGLFDSHSVTDAGSAAELLGTKPSGVSSLSLSSAVRQQL